MKNIERPEVIEKMIKYFSTPGLNSYREDHLSKDIGFKGKIYSKDFEKWANSEYVEPFEITKDEYCILKNLTDKYSEIKRSLEGYLFIKKDGGSWYLFNMYDHLFTWLHNGITVGIGFILNNCEVIE